MKWLLPLNDCSGIPGLGFPWYVGPCVRFLTLCVCSLRSAVTALLSAFSSLLPPRLDCHRFAHHAHPCVRVATAVDSSAPPCALLTPPPTTPPLITAPRPPRSLPHHTDPGSNPELVAAVSENGGFGIVQPIALTRLYKYDYREGLRYIRSLTDKPFGVNITILPKTAASARYAKMNEDFAGENSRLSSEQLSCRILRRVDVINNPFFAAPRRRYCD